MHQKYIERKEQENKCEIKQDIKYEINALQETEWLSDTKLILKAASRRNKLFITKKRNNLPKKRERIELWLKSLLKQEEKKHFYKDIKNLGSKNKGQQILQKDKNG